MMSISVKSVIIAVLLPFYHFKVLHGYTHESLNIIQEWNVTLGKQYPGITPMFTRTGNNLLIVSITQNEDNDFEYTAQTHYITGMKMGSCKGPFPSLKDRVWDMKLTDFNGAGGIVSWLFSDKTTREIGIGMFIFDRWTCDTAETELIVFDDTNYVYYLPYTILTYANEFEFDLFVRSFKLCGNGICRIKYKLMGNRYMQNDVTSFIDDDNSLIWRILPISWSDQTKGFYHIATSERHDSIGSTQIRKVSNDGTVIKTIETGTRVNDTVAFSNSYGHLGYCSSTSNGTIVQCLLLDSSLEKKLDVYIHICTEYCNLLKIPSKQMSMINTQIGGLNLLVKTCYDKHCFDHLTSMRSIDAKGNVSRSIEFFNFKGNCYPRSNYDLYELSYDSGVYCSGVPCMRKESIGDKVYDTMVYGKCVQGTWLTNDVRI